MTGSTSSIRHGGKAQERSTEDGQADGPFFCTGESSRSAGGPREQGRAVRGDKNDGVGQLVLWCNREVGIGDGFCTVFAPPHAAVLSFSQQRVPCSGVPSALAVSQINSVDISQFSCGGASLQRRLMIVGKVCLAQNFELVVFWAAKFKTSSKSDVIFHPYHESSVTAAEYEYEVQSRYICCM